jgi:hypothetical protein
MYCFVCQQGKYLYSPSTFSIEYRIFLDLIRCTRHNNFQNPCLRHMVGFLGRGRGRQVVDGTLLTQYSITHCIYTRRVGFEPTIPLYVQAVKTHG